MAREVQVEEMPLPGIGVPRDPHRRGAAGGGGDAPDRPAGPGPNDRRDLDACSEVVQLTDEGPTHSLRSSARRRGGAPCGAARAGLSAGDRTSFLCWNAHSQARCGFLWVPATGAAAVGECMVVAEHNHDIPHRRTGLACGPGRGGAPGAHGTAPAPGRPSAPGNPRDQPRREATSSLEEVRPCAGPQQARCPGAPHPASRRAA
jgi:hypothetical protein